MNSPQTSRTTPQYGSVKGIGIGFGYILYPIPANPFPRPQGK
ncbi:hypothetical protein [uncultured Nostoc sp.]